MSFFVTGGIAVFTAANGINEADKIRMAGELTEHLNQINAKYADVDAYEAGRYGESEVAAYQPQIDQTVSTQRAELAGKNVDVNSGTAAAIQADTRVTGLMNQLNIRAEAQARALGFQHEARNIRTGASVARDQANANADAVQSSAFINAVGSGFSMYGRKKGLV